LQQDFFIQQQEKSVSELLNETDWSIFNIFFRILYGWWIHLLFFIRSKWLCTWAKFMCYLNFDCY
jgi:hypothetical protein